MIKTTLTTKGVLAIGVVRVRSRIATGKNNCADEALACLGMVARAGATTIAFTTFDDDVCRCVRAVGKDVAARAADLLPHMFAAPLSPTLCTALTDLARHAPSLLPEIQERLLHVLSLVLSGRPFLHAGAAASGAGALTVDGAAVCAGGGGGGGGGASRDVLCMTDIVVVASQGRWCWQCRRRRQRRQHRRVCEIV
jgi:hypothetical protein